MKLGKVTKIFYVNVFAFSTIFLAALFTHIICLSMGVFWSRFTPFDSSLHTALEYSPSSSTFPPLFQNISSSSLDLDPKDSILYPYFSFLFHWDGVFFLKIALQGYSFEHQHAFFPLFPLIFNNLGLLITQFTSLSFLDAVILVHISLSFLFKFVIGLSIFRLGELLEFDVSTIDTASSIFLLTNPALIFFTSFYTESLFLFLVSLGVIGFHTYSIPSSKGMIISTIFFSLASFTRGNGILLVGFPIYRFLLLLLTKPILSKVTHSVYIIFQFILTVFSSILIILPNVLVQYFAFLLYCSPLESESVENHRFQSFRPIIIPPWCHDTIPSIYSYIQTYYWGNGFLKYYTPSQIPNFLLAGPMILFAFWSLKNRLGHISPQIFNFFSFSKQVQFQVNHQDTKVEQNFEKKLFGAIGAIKSFLIHPETVHWVYILILLLLSILFMNIQVTTRFLLASSPYIYLLLANLSPKTVEWIHLWGLCYSFVGTALFSTFLPWT